VRSAMVMRGPFTALVLVLALEMAAPDAASGKTFPVGVTTRTFVKASVTTGAPRVLDTVIWYPAVAGTGTDDALGRRDASVRRGRFPLILFSHGACGRNTSASYLMRALAADGFVVAAPPHPGHADADGRDTCRENRIDTYLNRVPDLQFTLDRMLDLDLERGSPFFRRLRRDAIGLTGVSFGGFTTLLAGQREPRLRALLPMVPGGIAALDPGDVAPPTLIIGAELDHSVGFAASEEAYVRLAGPRFLVELLGGDHLSVTDDCAPLCGLLDQDEGHRLVVRYAVPFFRRYLRNTRGAARLLGRAVDGVRLTAEPRREGASP
jgi:predicted dienelactone hydrolase